ncbi:MAG: PLP-dependent transferase [Alphaproteobacteria bacterium]|nr:PLP-dependent transferase [Alphaproteobacteria bacterium]
MKDLSKSNLGLSPDTLAAQGLGWEDAETGAVIPPVHLSTTFARDDQYQLPTHRVYARDGAASLDQAEAMISAFEQAQEAMVFASGLAACMAPFHALQPGDRVVAQSGIYFGVPTWLDEFGDAQGLEVVFVPGGDEPALLAAIAAAATALVWIENPSNPLMDVTDITAVAEATHRAGGVLCVDSTTATPVHCQPLTLGADIVVHSATKYLNGHSDLLAGALATRVQTDFWERIRRHRYLTGPLSGGFDLHLLVRGMRTLYLRVERQSANALAIAEFLEAHPKVARVRYPGLPSHPRHALAARQMQRGFGGLLSFHPKGGRDGALAAANALQVIIRATSLGGVESLVEHRHSVEPPGSGVPDDLLRLSVGIESAEDLIADLDRALAQL